PPARIWKRGVTRSPMGFPGFRLPRRCSASYWNCRPWPVRCRQGTRWTKPTACCSSRCWSGWTNWKKSWPAITKKRNTMKIDFKQPRYILPLIALPFLCVFFYVYQAAFAEEATQQEETEALQSDIADVSDGVKNAGLADKLAAYRQRYRDGDGYTAIGQL